MLFIVNPAAARGRAVRKWERLRASLIARRVEFSEQVTARPGEATDIARRSLQSNESCIIAVGGDGTLNEIVNGCFDSSGNAINPQTVVGLFPCGTGSDFSRSLEISGKKDVCRILTFGKTILIDLLEVEFADKDGNLITRHAVNAVSFGLGSEVVASVNSWRESWPRWIGGFPRFAVAALAALKNFQNRPVQIQLEGKTAAKSELQILSNFLVAANGRFAGGGMKFAPNAKLDDGLIDLVTTDTANAYDILKELPGIRHGSHLRNPKVKVVQSGEMTIRSQPELPLEIDGDTAGFTPARLIVKPAALRFLVDGDE